MTSFENDIGKLIILGNSMVGKSAVVQTYLSSGTRYPSKYQLTVGVSPYIKIIKFGEFDTDPVQLLIFDTTGLDLYRPFLIEYLKKEYFDMLLLVYDVTSILSLENLPKWTELVKNIKWNPTDENSDHFSTRPLFGAIFANKIDLSERRVVDTNLGENTASQRGLRYFEGSAKTNEGLNELFTAFAEKWYDHLCSRV